MTFPSSIVEFKNQDGFPFMRRRAAYRLFNRESQHSSISNSTLKLKNIFSFAMIFNHKEIIFENYQQTSTKWPQLLVKL